MSGLTSFLAGFLTAAVMCAGLAVAYYMRARKRVDSIKAAIKRYQEAQAVVGESVNKVYSVETPSFALNGEGTKKFTGSCGCGEKQP